MIYQISSGQGPAECELGVAKLLAHLQQNYDVSIIDSSPGYNEGTFRSVRIYSESDLSPISALSNGYVGARIVQSTNAKTGSLTLVPAL